MQFIICPKCGEEANYILTGGHTVTACSHCYQACVLETNIIIRLDKSKLAGQIAMKKELLVIALTAKALYDNWDLVTRTTVVI